MTDTSYIILRDIPKNRIVVNGTSIEIAGGFRGFRGVPAGTHNLELEMYNGEMLAFTVDVPPDDAVVYKCYDNERMAPDEEGGDRYRIMALSGAIEASLLDFPKTAKRIADRELIKHILSEHQRLLYLVKFEYKLNLDRLEYMEITDNSILLATEDGVQIKFVIPPESFADPMFAEVESPLKDNLAQMERKLDPALFQGILDIIYDYYDDEDDYDEFDDDDDDDEDD